MSADTGGGTESRDGRARIAALEREVAQLREHVADAGLVAELRARLVRVGATAFLGAPMEHDDLLEQITGTAMTVLRARAGSLYLVDEASGELVFEVALGADAAPLRGTRLPQGQGIAGWVAATGQALAVADVQRDARWAADVGRTTGYTPQAMLAVPLLVRDEVIGVLQALDKVNGAPFDDADMHLLGLFAQQAAVALLQAARGQSLAWLLRRQLVALSGGDDLADRGVAFARRLEQSADYEAIIGLADALGELVRRGEAGVRLAGAFLDALTSYVGAVEHPVA